MPGIPSARYETETALHVYCVTWLRMQWELTGDENWARWHHSANERLGARAGWLAKLMGQSKGVPDLIHMGRRIAVEFKLGSGLTLEQVGWIEYLRSLGWRAEVCRTFKEFKDVVS